MKRLLLRLKRGIGFVFWLALWPFKTSFNIITWPIRKLFGRKRRESMCGVNDLQDVEKYDGSLGVTQEFVAQHQGCVGQLQQCGSRSCSPDGMQRFCSGALISNDLFLTAGHCAIADPTELVVSFNYQVDPDGNIQKESHYKVLELVESGQPNGLDYCIYRLDGNPGEKWGFTKLAPGDPAPGDMLAVIQHPNGETKKIEAGNCDSVEDGMIHYGSLDTMPGSSGSPMFHVATGLICGVHTQGGCGDSGGTNSGTSIESILAVSSVAAEHVG